MKTKINRVLNLLLYLVGSLGVGTGLLLAYRLPPGSRGGQGLRFFGLDRHEWGDIHLVAALVLICLTIAHLALHWQWLARVAASRKFWRLGAGLAVGLGLIAFFLVLPVEQLPGPFDGH